MIHGRTYQWLEFQRGPNLSYDQLRLRDGQAKCDSRELTMLRRLPQRKLLTKIELCVSLSFLRLFRVGHVLQSRRSLLSFAWYEWFSCKGREWGIYCCRLASSSEPQKGAYATTTTTATRTSQICIFYNEKTIVLHALHVQFSFLTFRRPFSFFLRREMTCFAVVWTT